jgi:hypothetical protein
MSKLFYKSLLVLISGCTVINSVQAANSGLTINVNATIQAGTCYFDTTAITFDFGTVYPANIVSTDKTQRPASNDKSVVATKFNSGSDWSAKHTACDKGSTAMKFNIDAQGRSAMGADGKNIITLLTTSGKTGNLAQGFGITVYKVDGTTETPIDVGTDTAMGAPGNFKLRG